MVDDQSQQVAKIHPTNLTDDVFLIAHAETLHGVVQIEKGNCVYFPVRVRLVAGSPEGNNRQRNVLQDGRLQMSEANCGTCMS